MDIKTKKFFDGIAFYKDDFEIAFYSNITKRLGYNIDAVKRAYTDINMYGVIELPIEDIIFINKSLYLLINQ